MSDGNQHQLSPASCEAAENWLPCPVAAYLQPACTQLKVLQALQRCKLGRQAAARQLGTVEHEAVQALHRVRQRGRGAGGAVGRNSSHVRKPRAAPSASRMRSVCSMSHACLG